MIKFGWIMVCLLVAFSWKASAATASAAAAEPKTIYWLFFDFPGAVNFHDKNQAGYIMDIYFVLKKKMPEYTHQVVEVPFLRIIQQMKKKQGVCSLMILKNPDRESFMRFGTPYLQGLPAGVIVAKDNPKLQKYLKPSRMVNLETMLQDKTIQFGSIAKRFYGKKISEALSKYKTKQMIEKKDSNADHELKSMLKLGRIDVYFGYPIEVQGRDSEQLAFYFVKDNFETLEPRVSCEDSELGREVVAKTEDLRKKYKLDLQFDNIYERYYPKDLQKEFRKISK